MRSCWSATDRSSSSCTLSRGGFRAAIRVDEFHEDAHRRLMLALARSGDRTEALRQYDRLARRLQTDLDTEPTRIRRRSTIG
jgi:DNA-binding SARP family transcriptional activator